MPLGDKQIKRKSASGNAAYVQWYLEVSFFDRSNRHNDEDRSAQHKHES
jgi:hypothetical protein